MRLAILAAALLCAACSAATVQTAQKSIIEACSSYAVSLSTAADVRSSLSASTQITIDKIVAVVSPLCDPAKPLPTDTATSVNLVLASAAQLAAIIGAK